MVSDFKQLRIAFIAGTLGRGGAEKQLLYIARTLQVMGADVRIYSLSRGELYEEFFTRQGIPVIWFGQYSSVPLRFLKLVCFIKDFKPQFVQSCHTFTNLYAAGSARLSQAVDIGAVRSNVKFELKENGKWGPWLLKIPRWIVTNSYNARKNLSGIRSDENVLTLPNVIELKRIDNKPNLSTSKLRCADKNFTIIAVGRLIQAKRYDRLVKVLGLLRSWGVDAQVVIVGDGPERTNLNALAESLNLSDDVFQLLGERHDISWILSQGDAFVITSDHEGFPNVLLEAMAASLPIISTPVGECSYVIREGITGHLVDYDDINGMAERIRFLAQNPDTRYKMGEAGRRCVEQHYSLDSLPERLLEIYQYIAGHSRIRRSFFEFL